MSERVPGMSQSDVDLIFSQMTKDDTVSELVSPEEHYQHLVAQGYSDEEIEGMFGLKIDMEGKVYEV